MTGGQHGEEAKEGGREEEDETQEEKEVGTRRLTVFDLERGR
jgi:hypothetical protein